MAALTPAQIELANSLTQDELPTKLRCAVCSKLAVNAFRLPCCETAICETCQSTLPSTCPVCAHSPVSGADCSINKALRTTIRVFLKTEEKKREAARSKTNGSAPPTTVEATPTPALTQSLTEPPAAKDSLADSKDTAKPGSEDAIEPATSDPKESNTVTREHALPIRDNLGTEKLGDQAQTVVPSVEEIPDGAELDKANEDTEATQGSNPSELSGTGLGQDMMNGGFNGMNFAGGDMNQMQMMMAMQNGMNPAAFGSFPMMGMGMGMDPMAMQNMYMNGGFGAQGMGMNGMNMGMNGMNMGMNGFNGGGNNDWNGQQSWNVGQDNFNPNAAGMGNDDFGNFNSGFRTGYNSGNYGPHNQYNDYGRGGYGFRGRGRGRGFYRGYGRGYQQGYNPRHQGQQMWSEQISQYSGGDDTQADQANSGSAETPGEGLNYMDTDEFGRRVRPDSAQEGQNGHNPDGGHGETGEETQVSHESTGQVPPDNAPHPGDSHDNTAMYNGDVSSSDPYAQPGGSSYAVDGMAPSTTTPNIPLNAPKGPKAMRQGLPNTSTLHLRARGFIPGPRGSTSVTNVSLVGSPADEQPPSRASSRHSRKDRDRHHSERGREYDHEDKEVREKDQDKDHDRARSYSRSRSHSSRSRDCKESRRHRRHRSESVSDDDAEDEYRRHKHRSKRYTRDDDYKKRSKDDKYDDRSRSASPDRDRDRDREREHKRSSHRSHREREKENDRGSDKDRLKKSSHRSHRERDRDRDRDKDKDKERQKDRPRDRDRDRERERDREYRHRSRKTSAEPPTPVESAENGFNPPSGPRASISIKGASSKSGGFEIKGASSKSSAQKRESESTRRPSQSSTSAAKSASRGTGKDPHTLERETRDRERLLKEAQRMAGLNGLASLKRSRDAGDDRSGRRKSRRSEPVFGDEEERMRRSEAEREGGRWE